MAQKPNNEASAATDGYPFSRSPAEVRVQWMRLYGLSADEITQSLASDPPVDVGEEEKQLDSIVSIREMNADRCLHGCVADKTVDSCCSDLTVDY